MVNSLESYLLASLISYIFTNWRVPYLVSLFCMNHAMLCTFQEYLNSEWFHLSNQHSYQSNPNGAHNDPTYIQKPLVNKHKPTNDSHYEPNQLASGKPPYVKKKLK